MKEAFEQLDAEKQLLSTQLEKSSTYVEPTQTKQLIGMFFFKFWRDD
jgi:hypothetical protein